MVTALLFVIAASLIALGISMNELGQKILNRLDAMGQQGEEHGEHLKAIRQAPRVHHHFKL